MQTSLRKIGIFLVLIFINTHFAFAQTEPPQFFSLDGRLFEPGSTTDPLLDSSVVMTVQVLNPSKSCILYEEQQTVNTLGTNGYFNVRVGSGTGATKRSSLDTNNSMNTVFYNRTTAINGKTSGGGACTYTPAAGDERFFRFFITPSTVGSTAQLSPDMTLDSVPQAIVAQTLQGLGRDDVFHTSVTSTQAKLDNLLTTNYTNITDLISGTSTQYLRNAPTGTLLPTRATDPATPAAGQMWYDTATNEIKYYNGTAVTAVGAAGSGITSLTAGSGLDGGTITTSGTISVASGGITNSMLASGIDAAKVTTGTLPAGVVPSGTDSSKLPLAGGTLTGAVTMGAATSFAGFDLLGTGHITMNSQRTITIGRYDTTQQNTTLIPSLTGANAGAVWYNSTTGKLMFWNGSAAFEISETTSAGGDITAINTNAGSGLTGGVTSGPATLAINVDGATLEVATNTVQVKDAGIALIKLAADSVNSAKIVDDSITSADVNDGTLVNADINASAAIAWSKIDKTGATAADVGAVPTTRAVNTNSGSGLTGGGALSADRNLSVVVDNSTIEIATNTVQVKDGGITNAKIASLNITKLTQGAGDYFSYMPAGTECNPSEVLKWNAVNDRWECGTDATGVSDHGLLSGLSDDDHTQYVMLAGRSGGQVVRGGTASGDDLTLESTSNATKGDVLLQPTGGNVGVGTAAPATPLHIVKGGGNQIRLQDNTTYTTLSSIDTVADGAIMDISPTPTSTTGAVSMRLFRTTDTTAGVGLSILKGNNTTTTNARIAGSGDTYFAADNGGVGIGTTVPSKRLHVRSDGAFQMRLQNANTGGGFWNIGQADNAFGSGGGKLLFVPDTDASTSAAVAFTNSGNVGIGTTTPSVTLDMNTRTDAVRLPAGTTAQRPTGANGYIRYNTTNNKFEVYEGGAWVNVRDPASNTSVVGATGTAAAPTYSFTGETDTGFYNSGTNAIGVSVGTSQIFQFTSAGLVSPTTGGGYVLTGNGTAATPTYSFAGDSNTGWYRAAEDTLAAATAGTERIRIDDIGNVGIGATPTARLEIGGTITATSGWNPLTKSVGVYWPASAPGAATYTIGTQNYIETGGAADLTQVTAYGSVSDAKRAGTTPMGVLVGANASSSNTTAGTVTRALGSESFVYNTSTGTITTAVGNYIEIQNTGGGSIGTSIGLQIGNIAGTDNYAIYQTDTSAQNYFAARVGIGTTAPAGILDVNGGTGGAQVYLRGDNTGNTNSLNFVDSGTGRYWHMVRRGSDHATNPDEFGMYFSPNAGVNFHNYMNFIPDLTANNNAGNIHFPGMIGIGTSAPSSLLHVYRSGATSQLTIETGGGGTTPAAFLVLKDGNATAGAQAYGIKSQADTFSLNLLNDAGTSSITRILTENASGEIGIGTSSPYRNLHVNSALGGSTGVTLENTATGGRRYSLLSTNNTSTEGGSRFVLFDDTAGFSRIAVTSAGNVGIGTNTPATRLEIATNTSAKLGNSYWSSGGDYTHLSTHTWYNGSTWTNDGTPGALYQQTGQTHTWYRHNGASTFTSTMSLDPSGNLNVIGTYNSSDERLKTNIMPVENSLVGLTELTGVTYNWRNELERDPSRQMGLLAQDVQKVFPEAVKKDKDGWLSVSYTSLIGPIINAIKELYGKVLINERNIASLKSESAQKANRKDVLDSLEAKDKEIAKLKAAAEKQKQENAAIKSYLCAKDPKAPFCK